MYYQSLTRLTHIASKFKHHTDYRTDYRNLFKDTDYNNDDDILNSIIPDNNITAIFTCNMKH